MSCCVRTMPIESDMLFLQTFGKDSLQFCLIFAHDGHHGSLLADTLLFLGLNLVLDFLEKFRVFCDYFKELLDLIVAHACSLQLATDKFFKDKFLKHMDKPYHRIC